MSKITSELDDLISTGLSLPECELENLNNTFEEDEYIDWQKKLMDQNSEVNSPGKRVSLEDKERAVAFSKRYLFNRKE